MRADVRRSLFPFVLTLASLACGDEDQRPNIVIRDASVRDVGFVDTGAALDAETTEDATAIIDAESELDASAALDADSLDTGTLDATSPDADSGVADSGMSSENIIQLLSISDWHGQLEPLPPAAGSTVAIGGAAVLGAYFAKERRDYPQTLLVTSGDAFGGSPPISSFFDEEPTIEALGLLDLAVDTLGNHNFDRGLTHLQQMIDGASYPFVSSNLGNLGTNLRNVVTPYHMVTLRGVKVAFVGITNPEAPQLTFPGRMGTLTVLEPVAAALAARNAAVSAGAQIIVGLVHLGATSGGPTPAGPLIDFARAVSGFHVIFGDHTDIPINTVINGAVVLENKSKGATYGRVRLAAQGTTVTLRSADIVTPLASSSITPEPAIVGAVEHYRTQLAPQLDVVVGTANGEFAMPLNGERTGEAAIGNLVADAIRSELGVELGLMNGGGIRSGVPSAYRPVNTRLRRTTPPYLIGPPYDVVLGDAYAVQPFSNFLVTRDVTGQQIWAMLEHGVSGMPQPSGKFPQISGFRFTYTASAAPGSRILSVTLDDGRPIPRDGSTYSLGTTEFLNRGGDGYTMLNDGTGVVQELDAVVLADFIANQPSVTPRVDGRITRVYGTSGVDAGTGRDASIDASVDAGNTPDSGPRDAGVSPDGGVTLDGGMMTPIAPSVAGDLVISEIMKDPRDLADNVGEWFEIYNPTGHTFELQGCVVADDGSDSFSIASSLLVAPGDYVSLAVTSSPGFVVDYDYAGFLLANTDDEVILTCGGVQIDAVRYGVSGFPNNPAGSSLSLSPAALDGALNDLGSSWCAGSTAYGATDKGTPGAINPPCP